MTEDDPERAGSSEPPPVPEPAPPPPQPAPAPERAYEPLETIRLTESDCGEDG